MRRFRGRPSGKSGVEGSYVLPRRATTATEPHETEARTALPLDFEEREIVLRADFEDLDEEGCLLVSLHFLRGPRHPRAGETVYLLGGHGRACMAQVTSVNGWIARVRPDSALSG